jgi:hypothetical protein
MKILPLIEEPFVLSNTRKEEMMQRRDQLTTYRRFTLSQVGNAEYKRHQLLHGLPEGTR